MDHNNQSSIHSINNLNVGNGGGGSIGDNNGSRFRVDRIQPAIIHPQQMMTTGMPNPHFLNSESIHLQEINENAVDNIPSEISSQFLHPTRRRSSIVPGLGGVRKKSVTLPKEFNYGLDEEDNASQASTTEPPSHPTIYGKNFSYYNTLETLPKYDNYTNNLENLGQGGRPTIEELRSEAMFEKKADKVTLEEGVSDAIKLGWIEGVLVRCLLNIWGVLLFLRLSWVVAQAGIGLAIVIIMLSVTVTTLTALSMSSISTNGQIKGGGIYFMISRALGPEFGGAVGAIFSFANATAVAMHTVGFSESLNDLLKTMHVKIFDNAQNDIRVTGTIAIIVMQSIIIIGMEWESKAQVVLLIVLLIAIFDFLLGAFIGPLDYDEISRGFVGFNGTVMANNFVPNFREENGKRYGFFTIFAIFFPSATGITAGANISGDLKDPPSAIPKGTLLAIFFTTTTYIIFVLLSGASCIRDATGPILINGTIDFNATEEMVKEFGHYNCNFTTGGNTDCTGKWGTHNSFQVIELMAIFGPIIYAGCFAASLSSALACLVSAPKILQALARDKLYPGLEIFGRGYRKNDDPFFAYALAFVISVAFLLIADLNAVASLISNFYMMAYFMVNFCAFHAHLIKPLGWRPMFKYCNKYSSFVGSILCVAIMFLMSWITALITFGIISSLFFILVYIKPDVNWGGSGEAQTFVGALKSVQSLNNLKTHVKNFRPHILVLSGRPSTRPTLIDFANLLSKNTSMLICGHIVQERQTYKVREYLRIKSEMTLMNKKVKGFYALVDDVEFENGARCLMQSAGVGKLRPNLVLIGYKTDWILTPDKEDVKAYFRVIHDILDNHMGILILRLREGFDYSMIIAEDSEEAVNSLIRNDSEYLSLAAFDADGTNSSPTYHIEPDSPGGKGGAEKKDKVLKQLEESLKGFGGSPIPKAVLMNLSQFMRKQRKSTIDIWWLYDDGGLTMLIPYILSNRTIFAGCKLRIFALGDSKSNLEVDQANLANLLAKFRIPISDLTVLTDVTEKAKDKTWEFFNGIIKEYKNSNDQNMDPEMEFDDSELKTLKEKTNRHLRLRELLFDYSRMANLIVMTLPVPRKGGVSAPLYFAWLECLTKDMPPFLLLRGNQESVLTFYS